MMKNKLMGRLRKRRNHKRAVKITKKRYAMLHERVYKTMQSEFNKGEEFSEHQLFHDDDPQNDPTK